MADRGSMNLTLAPGILDEVIAHAKTCYPLEGCGLIAGMKTSAPGTRLIPISNVARNRAEFEMDPGELIRALKDLRNAAEVLVAIYHSHPHGPASLSKVDVERAYYPEAAHLIVSLADPERPRIAAFRLVDGEAVEIEVHAIV